MRVKKIELIGFKSFADRTEIHLGEGVTCVVGPNGCGKSNISDAIRWVFGERSAKLLRGTRMEDVIFSGTEFRKPTGMAEVSLTLDNSDHALPIDYEEVVFSRRLYRSGQSEYFLNRTPCRLRDLLSLILDTGMGSNSYSMIEQGRVDSVIQADPRDRRFLIEEAAGISKYKVKKEEALRKLERTEQNLLRIRDIVSEVQKNIQYAERQARRAERYKVQFEELKKLEVTKAFLELTHLETEKASESTKKSEMLSRASEVEKELSENLARQAELEKLFAEIQREESDQSARCHELKSELRALAQEQEFNTERTQEGNRRHIEIEKEKELLTKAIVDLEKELATKLGDREESSEEQKKIEDSLKLEENQFQEEEREFEARKEEAQKLKELVFDEASKLAHLRTELGRLCTLLEAGQREIGRRAEGKQKQTNEKISFERKQLSYQEEMALIARELQESTSLQEDITHRLEMGRKEIEKLARETTLKKLRFQESTSRLRLIQELDETADLTEKKILSSVSRDRLRGKIVRTLREVLEIQGGYEAAVEAVLGSFAQGLIAEDVETAQGLLLEMAESHSGPCGIFVQSLIKPNGKTLAKKSAINHPQVRHGIEEVVRIQNGFDDLFKPLFENVYVVEDFSPVNLGELLPLAQRARLVTKEGILLGPESRIFFRNGRLSPDQGPFHRRAEIAQLSQTGDSLGQEIQQLESKTRALEEEFANLEKEKGSCEERVSDILVRKKAAESLLQGIGDRLQALEEELRLLDFENAESARETGGHQNKILELKSLIAQHEKSEIELRNRQTSLDQLLRDLQQGRETRIRTLARNRAFVETFHQNLLSLNAGETLMKTQITASRDRLVRLDQELETLEDRLRQFAAASAMLKQRSESLQAEHAEAEAEFNETRGKKSFHEESIRRVFGEVSEKKEQLLKIQAELHQEELRTLDVSYREKSIYDRLRQTYNVNLEELRREDYLSNAPDTSLLDDEIRSLKEKIDAFGPVNLLAVDEYEELKHRYEFLSSQEKDLNDARESLLEAIRKINRTTKTLFAETFAKSQAFFQEYYQILFNGGHAELTLVQTEEDEEAGVDIMVRPPGKKLQHISLLSGGEKALTAMALLFALFRIKASPLCVLDEVDAPLDEANVDRFIKVLRTFLGNTQFLIVTHNRKTIAMGDYLYGITMEESGVSKVVSVKVAQGEAKVPISSPESAEPHHIS